MIPCLPEALVADRQEIYFRYFFGVPTRRDDVITDDDVRHHAAAYGWADVTTHVVADGQHYLVEEDPTTSRG